MGASGRAGGVLTPGGIAVGGCLFPSLGTLDGAASDAGTTDHGATDASGEASLGFCASQSPQPKFCDDFDDGGALLGDGGHALPPWDDFTATNGSTAVLDQALVESP